MTNVRFNGWWVGLWFANCAVLAGLAAVGISAAAWTSSFVVLFLLPEMVGLVHRGDSLPPLTYAVRRYLPRWLPSLLTVATGAWLAGLWLLPDAAHPDRAAHHPLVVLVAVAGMVGWLLNHWDVTYDGPGE